MHELSGDTNTGDLNMDGPIPSLPWEQIPTRDKTWRFWHSENFGRISRKMAVMRKRTNGNTCEIALNIHNRLSL